MGIYVPGSPSGSGGGGGPGAPGSLVVPWGLQTQGCYGYTAPGSSQHVVQQATAVNALILSMPWYSGPTPITINIDTYVATAYSAGSLLLVGCYTQINQTNPYIFDIIHGVAYATLLQSFGTIDITTTGRKTLNPAQVIPANTWFSLAAVEQNSGAGARYIGYNTSGGPSPFGTANSASCYFSYQANGIGATGQSGALPANFIPTTVSPSDPGIGLIRIA